jgi:hypothetical protein
MVRWSKKACNYLNQAVANRANYDDAMAYLNLIYRRKADVDYGNAAAVKDDMAQARGVAHQRSHGHAQGQ